MTAEERFAKASEQMKSVLKRKYGLNYAQILNSFTIPEEIENRAIRIAPEPLLKHYYQTMFNFEKMEGGHRLLMEYIYRNHIHYDNNSAINMLEDQQLAINKLKSDFRITSLARFLYKKYTTIPGKLIDVGAGNEGLATSPAQDGDAAQVALLKILASQPHPQTFSVHRASDCRAVLGQEFAGFNWAAAQHAPMLAGSAYPIGVLLNAEKARCPSLNGKL